MSKNISDRLAPLRFPLILLAIFSLLAAIWAGWIRIGWPWPPGQPLLIALHGPLMVSGFLGTLISLERAVALLPRVKERPGASAAFVAAPALSGLGSLLLILGVPGWLPLALIAAGSLLLLAMMIFVARLHTALYTVVMAIGAGCWLAGNLLWLGGWPVYRVVPLWAAFLVLTIAGERLELGRILRLSRLKTRLFAALVGLLLLGLVGSLVNFDLGTRLTGLGFLGLAAWLLWNDMARKTIRQRGLPRFIAACLLSGFAWLGVGGVLYMVYGGVAAGLYYDAALHAIFLGFVMAMIFAHAPIVFPAVLGRPIRYSPFSYIYLALLDLSLLMRLMGDLQADFTLRRWGGLFNGIAILLFLGSTAVSLLRKPSAGSE
jgi:hypothetical protein